MAEIRNDFPLKLDSPRVWRTYTGGASIDQLHGSPKGEVTHFPEEWIMSVVAARNAGREDIMDEGMSRLPEHGNITLKELIDGNPEYYLGKKHVEKNGAQPGVLVKLIDSAERLTVQVHPDRDMAGKLFGSRFGKTESWHILDTHPVNGESACIYIGFKPGITRKHWKELFDNQDIPGMLDFMHRVEVKKGDTVLIKGGVPHAIGAGCFLAEVQEPTDYTIRIERVTPSGLAVADSMCHQGLGFERMFECFKYEGVTEKEAIDRWFVRSQEVKRTDGGTVTSVLGYDATKFFCLDKITAEGTLEIECLPGFSGIYVLDGAGILHANGQKCRIEKAEQYFIPAATERFRLDSEGETPLQILRFMGPE